MSYKEYCDTIKKVIRKKQINYATLAETIEIPVSTLKKQLNASDGSVNRLKKICEGLQLPFSEVVSAEQHRPSKALAFSDKQQKLFARDRLAFNVFWSLAFERKPLQQTKERLKISDTAFKKILFKLDKVDLIKLDVDETPMIPKLQLVHWRPADPFSQALFREWSQQVSEDSLNDQTHVLQHFQLTEMSRKDLAKQILELEDEFARRTLRELRLYPDKVTSVRCVLATAEGSFIPEPKSLIKS